MSSPAPVVQARALRKQYGALTAVDGIDFEVRRGECFGFLGPNGAGKTTTMRMIYCAAPVGGGALEVLGHPVNGGPIERLIKQRVGVVPQEQNLDEEMTLRENLELFARFYGVDRAAARARATELMELVGLSAKADAKIITLSGGMKRRALIARGLLGEPDVLVLDEPTTGLDPQARQQLWTLLARLKQREATLLLTTHYMEEAERLCDRLVVMDDGRIVARGTPASLIAEHASPHVVELPLVGGAPPAGLDGLRPHAVNIEVLADRVLLHADDGEALIAQVAAQMPGQRALLRRGNLEDVFLALTGRALEDA